METAKICGLDYPIGAIALIFATIKERLPEDDKSLFLAQAGYTLANWQQLETDLRIQILPLDATPTEETRYGNKYQIRGFLVRKLEKLLSKKGLVYGISYVRN